MSPTKAPSCGLDDWQFKVDNNSKQGCGWVGREPYVRCLTSTGAKDNCVKSCCGIFLTSSPTPTVTNSTNGAPSCVIDWTYKHNGDNGKGCAWVEREDTANRCLLEGAAQACCEKCDVPVHYHNITGYPQSGNSNDTEPDHDH